jgi:hypothetical protein
LQKVTVKDGQYLFEDNNVLVTIDAQGILYRKYEVLPAQVKGKGMNYFIGEEGLIFTVDSMGFVNIVKNDPKMKMATKFGGNFFVVNNDEIFTVRSDGPYAQTSIEGSSAADIVAFGGNYFMNNRGFLHTVSHEGKVIPYKQDRIGIILKKGLN